MRGCVENKPYVFYDTEKHGIQAVQIYPVRVSTASLVCTWSRVCGRGRSPTQVTDILRIELNRHAVAGDVFWAVSFSNVLEATTAVERCLWRGPKQQHKLCRTSTCETGHIYDDDNPAISRKHVEEEVKKICMPNGVIRRVI